MGIGMPRSHNKMYPVAPACCIVVLSFITCVLSSESDWQAFCVFPAGTTVNWLPAEHPCSYLTSNKGRLMHR